MAVVPASHTFAAGVATTSEANTYIRDPIAFLLTPPACRLRQTVAQSLTTSVYASITFTTEDLDNVNGHDNITNPSRYTAQYSGWYSLGGGVNFAANVTGYRACRWAVNGTLVNGSEGIGQAVAVAGFGSAAVARAELVYLNVGDYVELQGLQASGGPLNTDVGVANASTMAIRWVSN